MKLLAIAGSLRQESSNKTLLLAAAKLAPKGVTITFYMGLGDIPPFNPDLESSLPSAVKDFYTQVKEADGLLISSPEYAHGVSGVLKNALDWLVGGDAMVGKPVALFNASPRATLAHASLMDNLTTMSGLVVKDACLPVDLLGKKKDEAQLIDDPQIAEPLKKALETFVRAIQATQAQQ